eukprot:215281-Chlamydomonas_euryale.AAC.2
MGGWFVSQCVRTCSALLMQPPGAQTLPGSSMLLPCCLFVLDCSAAPLGPPPCLAQGGNIKCAHPDALHRQDPPPASLVQGGNIKCAHLDALHRRWCERS